MAGYNNYVGKIAGDLEKSNMQMHMRGMSGETPEGKKKILQSLIDYELSDFIYLIYDIITDHKDNEYDIETLSRFFTKNESDFIPLFTKMNEDCLNDPKFSEAIVNGELYTKKMGTRRDWLIYYPSRSGTGSVTHEAKMDLLYSPTIYDVIPNKFRLEFTEVLNTNGEYPYITFSIDIGDDGSISFNEPIICDKQERNGEIVIVNKPSDMSKTHFILSNDIEIICNGFKTIFEKCGIKENRNTNSR